MNAEIVSLNKLSVSFDAVSLRHDLSSAISILNTSFDEALASAPSLSDAKELFDLGEGKLREIALKLQLASTAVAEPARTFSKTQREVLNGALFALRAASNSVQSQVNVDALEIQEIYSGADRVLRGILASLDRQVAESKDLPEEQQYLGVKEATYSANHPEVLKWTKFFRYRTLARDIFAAMTGVSPSTERARVVSVQWHRFSEFMPAFLCQAAAMVTTNEKRHYVIQTAFEELGMRDVHEIHPDMFWAAAATAGASDADRMRMRGPGPVQSALDDLWRSLVSFRTDPEVLGILLGLEIPAEENIEMIFTSLGYSEPVRAELAKTKFFALHRAIEIEHVRLTVSNFLRFCSTDEQRTQFVRGFDAGLDFWKRYWKSVSEAVSCELNGEVAHA